jgi:uncharacterized repeat protein (TIGR01451 family)
MARPFSISPSRDAATGVALATATLLVSTAESALAQSAPNFGDTVTNTARVSYQIGEVVVDLPPAEAVFTIRAPDTPPTIQFFRYSPNAPQPVLRRINGSDFSPTGRQAGPFESTGAPVTAGGAVLDLSGDVPLIEASTYLADELMFVQVMDLGANTDRASIDTLVITVEADTGDTITLRLYEIGPDTGEFFAYMPSSTDTTPRFDGTITVGNNAELTARYRRALTSTEIVVDTATVNPLNRVFSSVTGEDVSNAVVTLLNVDTGERAQVFGVDGFSPFPAQVVSGDDVTDGAGLIYDNDDGEFRYPVLEPGTYIIEVDPPEGYTFASAMEENVLRNMPIMNGTAIGPGSYGLPFTVTERGPLRLDIPLDPLGDLTVTKNVDRIAGDVGDFVNYTVVIDNVGQGPASGILHDLLPVGFRFVPGTARIEGEATTDPDISDDGVLLTFDMDTVMPGESVRLDYALRIGPGAIFGTAVNEAVMRGPDGEVLSNTGRAGIEIREDLLRQRSTIIGRMTEESCDGSDGWARPIERGIGVPGVRLYMETGAYTVSDADGLFHFEGVREGTHVVQVDQETLPQGYELMACEENTRFAGSIDSQFVDVQGGGIWRANFYLKRTGDVAEVVEEEVYNDRTAYQDFDANWLATQDATPAIAYPAPDRTPSQKASHIGIKHAAGQSVSLQINGRDIPPYFRTAVLSAPNGASLSQFKGVPLEDGRNVLVATIRGKNGKVVSTLRQDIHFVDTIARIVPLPDQSVLVADGRTVPEIAIRFEDEAGRPVHAGRITRIEIEPPYRLYDENGENFLREQSETLISPLSASQELSVGADGVVRVALEPTLRTGKVTINAVTDTGRIVPVYMNLAPEKRDWILVGLAEGTAALDRVRGNATGLIASGSNPDDVPAEAFMSDGRVAFFAKGMVKGEWLMTLALDTDKRKSRRGSNADGDFLGEIDPNAYYTLYGDRSYQEFEGVSRYPLYIKLEKRQAYALFGDYDTNVTEGRLTAYNRRLSGLKAEYLGDNFQVLGFAAETNQGFALDEIPADGTSGTYQLSNSHILAQSEEIVLETRDRVRPDVVLERKTLVRFLDYTLDYLTGELLFRLPVDATDAEFNPVVIVANYETSEEAERNVTFGGRVQTQLADNRVQLGSTFVHEDGSAQAAGVQSTQVGVDVQVAVSDNTHARLEYAVTDTADGGTADAKLVELIHTSEKLVGEAYMREQEAGFGLGQRTSNTTSVRRYGARASYRVSETDDVETGERTTRHVRVDAYREENLGTGDARSSGEVTLEQSGRKLNGSVGLRAVSDELVGRDNRDSILAVGRVSYDLDKHGATVELAHEQPLGGQDEVSAQPMRTALTVSKRLGTRARVTLRHDRTDGEFAVANTTAVGVDVMPWAGAQLTAASDMVSNDSGRRLGATVGLDQQVRIDENWTVSAGLRDRTVLDSDSAYVEVAPDAAVSPFEINEDFTSAYVGLGYSKAGTTASIRGETRITSDQETYIGSLSAARSLTETLSFAGSARLTSSTTRDVGTESRADLRLGASWRPKDEGLVVFDRLDISHYQDAFGVTETKVVNNLAANTWINDRWQLTGNWGTKYTQTDIAGQSLSNWTNLLGGETRYDVTPRIDVGLRGQMMVQSDSGAMDYSWGPSIGFNPAKNVWISAGYNVDGFRDDDFEAADYSRKGPYITMRFKFDQHTAEGLLRRISPSSLPGEAANEVIEAVNPPILSQPQTVVPHSAPIAEPAPIVEAAPVAVAEPVSAAVLAPIVDPAPQPVLTIAPAPMTEPVQEILPAASVLDANLNVCAKSSVAIFNVPEDAKFEQVSRLGLDPQFGDSHDLSPREFYMKLKTAYEADAGHAAYLDYLFQSIGYGEGWAAARPDMFSDAVIPEGTRGIMGFGEQHHFEFKILPTAEQDRQAFRIESANGEVIHFMKTCGNYFYGCESAQ